VYSISVVIPVYNSSAMLPQVVQRLSAILPTCADDYEVILVNDGSRDQSWSVIENLSAEWNWVRGVNLMRNYGQGNALLCGIRAATKDMVVTMDDDGQHPPEEIPKLLAKLTPEFDVVFGTPQEERHGFLRDLASVMTKRMLQGAMGVDAAKHSGPFRAFRVELRKAFENFRGQFVSIDVLLTWATTRFTWVHVKHASRIAGQSGYTLRKLITHALNLITGFSVLPLQIASYVGMAFAALGALMLLFVIGRFLLQGGVVQGFAFLASAIAIFSGVQLFALGIIGEYLARTYLRVTDRPTYVVRNKI
jgi:undecaprenyl-phosphate 4-deoxy-4-formamido-L-arabinose transferase